MWALYEGPQTSEETKTLWAVENSNLQGEVFSRGRVPVLTMQKIAQNVGKNQAISQAVVDFLVVVAGKENVADISPKAKGAKITAERVFRAFSDNYTLINYNGTQDQRDAFKLAEMAVNFKRFKN